MKTYCVIQGGVAHEFVEGEAWPFHPDLPHADVTGQDVQLGDLWDGAQFTRAALVTHQPPTTGTTYGVTVYKLTPAQPLAPHSHNRAHLLLVASGIVVITEGEVRWKAAAPSVCVLNADTVHRVDVIGEAATILSIFAEDL